MSAATPALIAAAGGVGFGHAILPDHWLPLAVVGRTRRYPVARIARLSALAGVAHVLVSLLLGAVIIAIGLQFRSSVKDAQDAIVGGILILTGLGFFVAQLVGRRHDHPHDRPDREHAHGITTIMVPFGAAASPDLTILPVFVAAAASGAGPAIGTLVAFGGVTIVTIVTLTVLATLGGYQIRGAWLERWAQLTTGAVLLMIGVLVLVGAI